MFKPIYGMLNSDHRDSIYDSISVLYLKKHCGISASLLVSHLNKNPSAP